MPFVRTFSNFAPPSRSDGNPFTTALIQESAASTGPWATISTISLATGPGVSPTGVDADPSSPQKRTLTTASATIDPNGWYRIVWQDAALAQYISDALQIVSPTLTVIETLVRSEMPYTWDGLAGSTYLGLTVLRSRVFNVKTVLVGSSIAAQAESSLSAALQSYIAKSAALDLISTGIEYWMRQKTTLSATGTNETVSFTDPINALKELAKRLAAEVAALAVNPDIIASMLTHGELPALLSDADMLTPDPYEFPPSFGSATTTTTAA